MPKCEAESIQDQLNTLAPKAKVVFTLLCAERLQLCLRKLGEMRSDLKPEPVVQALEHAFRVATAEAPFDADHIRNLLSICELSQPDWDDVQKVWHSQTSDAVVAVQCSLALMLEDSHEEVATAAEVAYQSAQFAVQSLIERTAGARDEAYYETPVSEIDRHEIVQRELGKQRADLQRLAERDTLDSTFITALRTENARYFIPTAPD
jgi:hypothetical protein